MKKKSFFSTDLVILTVAILLFAALCYGGYHAISSDIYAKDASKENLPRFTDPERYIMVEETDSDDFAVRSFIFDVESGKAYDIEREDDDDKIVVFIECDSVDYERIYAGKVTQQELDDYKLNIKWALHEDEVELCHTTYDKAGNVTNHYHSKNDSIIEPSEKCENCIAIVNNDE